MSNNNKFRIVKQKLKDISDFCVNIRTNNLL